MNRKEILFDLDGNAIRPDVVRDRIDEFGESYNHTVMEIIHFSRALDPHGEVFIQCASRLLSNFGMTRRGAFHKKNRNRILRNCWDVVGEEIIRIKKELHQSKLNRDRYILALNVQERNILISEIWSITKALLPFTMGKTSYGLVGASKILFSVLPEIVLPVDNAEWLHVFRTVDLGDVLHRMVFDIQKWEEITGVRFNDLDPSKRLTTLPSVYNVMAMHARP